MNRRRLLVVLVLVLASAASAAPAGRRTAAIRRASPVSAAAQTAHRRSPYVGAVSACEVYQVVRENGKSVRRKTWRILSSDGADAEAYPASVTKLMTLLLVLEDIRAGRYAANDRVTATPDVYRCEPSWIGLKVGETMSVRDLLLALMVESANDAAIALGVHSAGSFEAFVSRMNARAAELGMTRTRYHNPNGLPPNAAKRYPWKSFNVTTAADQLRLAMTLLNLPEVTEYTSVKTCDLVRTASGYRVAVTRRTNRPPVQTVLSPGETLAKTLRNHNNLMVKDKLRIRTADGREAVDGLKTGYINAGGSSVVVSASSGDRRVLAVVLGSSSAAERDEHAGRLVSDGLGAAW